MNNGLFRIIPTPPSPADKSLGNGEQSPVSPAPGDGERGGVRPVPVPHGGVRGGVRLVKIEFQAGNGLVLAESSLVTDCLETDHVVVRKVGRRS